MGCGSRAGKECVSLRLQGEHFAEGNATCLFRFSGYQPGAPQYLQTGQHPVSRVDTLIAHNPQLFGIGNALLDRFGHTGARVRKAD